MGNTYQLLSDLSRLNATGLVSALYNLGGKLTGGDKATINSTILSSLLLKDVNPVEAKNKAQQMTSEIANALADRVVIVQDSRLFIPKNNSIGPKSLAYYTACLRQTEAS